MAEILIKGLALPKPSTYPITLSIYPNGNIYIHHELSDYKAIEVPTPHGRLVDIDRMISDSKGKAMPVYVQTLDDLADMLETYADLDKTDHTVVIEAST